MIMVIIFRDAGQVELIADVLVDVLDGIHSGDVYEAHESEYEAVLHALRNAEDADGGLHVALSTDQVDTLRDELSGTVEDIVSDPVPYDADTLDDLADLRDALARLA